MSASKILTLTASVVPALCPFNLAFYPLLLQPAIKQPKPDIPLFLQEPQCQPTYVKGTTRFTARLEQPGQLLKLLEEGANDLDDELLWQYITLPEGLISPPETMQALLFEVQLHIDGSCAIVAFAHDRDEMYICDPLTWNEKTGLHQHRI
ncbi:hypothetical protein LJ739_08180 [Aestuariibacter halophilus]|uniref:Uncharacterized protein n=1 Tax=Fluctibacter halophilus TaxID=226011 RepID=A0ABS8G6J5_9ALTE|nr:hypothetical protein [Aestuariibacter halophilus]MCC2616214.1 hypothetical protein [Aestuariibacter halophilus]